MNRRRLSVVSALAAACVVSLAVAYPQPSTVPSSWELKFKADLPKRIVVDVPGSPNPKAYWYVTYSVTNTGEGEVSFLPTFEWVTKEGKVLRSDKSIPSVVFQQIKAKNGNKLLEDAVHAAGTLREGEDQAKDSVAIWEEPEARLGEFSIFVTGLSGESTQLKDGSDKPMMNGEGKPILLYKTLELDYRSAGDEVYPGNDLMVKLGQKWVMR